MKAAVWKTKSWEPSRYDDTEIKRVIFKGLDDNKSYYLNLNSKYPMEASKWEPYLKEGTVLDINLQPNGKNVNYFSSFNIIKTV